MCKRVRIIKEGRILKVEGIEGLGEGDVCADGLDLPVPREQLAHVAARDQGELVRRDVRVVELHERGAGAAAVVAGGGGGGGGGAFC